MEVKKIPVKFAHNLAPFCPICGSGEYMTNEDGNENSYCGQCGTPLDWENREDIDTGELVRIRGRYGDRCCKCLHFTAICDAVYKGTRGNCRIKPNLAPRRGTQKACKKFKPSIREFKEG